jgi:hypothetical protein
VRGLAGALIGTTTALIAMWCALRIGQARQTASWPPMVTSAIAAAAMGLVGVLALLPRHLELVRDPIQAALRQLPATLDAEIRGLCARAAAIWRSAQTQIADELGQQLVRDGVLKTLEVASRSAQVRVAGPSEAELAQRKDALDQRIAAATDAEAKAQYQAARGALDDQQRYRDQIRQGHDRLVARLHNHVAALEKFELAATSHQASRAASAEATAVSQLEELSQSVAASSEALAELGELTSAA